MAEENKLGLDLSFFESEKASEIKLEEEPKIKKKRGRKPSTETVVPRNATEVVQYANGIEEPYTNSFKETQNVLKGTVIQADDLAVQIQEDIAAVRASKTLKNKYTYLTNLTASASSLISTKVQTIREMNNTIKTCHELELKRQSQLHSDKLEQNDDMKMMDMYNAFVNAPVGVYQQNTRPMTMGDAIGISGTSIIDYNNTSSSPLTPEQNRMRLENNPNIKEVVKFNQSTGERYFDVIDSITGESIPNYPRPDAFLLEGTTIDVAAGIARNRNIDQIWPLVVMGSADY